MSPFLLGVSEDQDDRVAPDEELGDEAVLVDRGRALLALARLGDLHQHALYQANCALLLVYLSQPFSKWTTTCMISKEAEHAHVY